jgi:hypothetical protein
VTEQTLLSKVRNLSGFIAYCPPLVKALDGDRDGAIVLMWLLFRHEAGIPVVTADEAEQRLAMPRATFFRSVRRLVDRELVQRSRKRHGTAYEVNVVLLCNLLGIDHDPGPDQMNQPDSSEMNHPEPSGPQMNHPEPSEMNHPDTPDESICNSRCITLSHLTAETQRTDWETRPLRSSLDIVDIPPNPPGGTDALTGGEQTKADSSWTDIRSAWVQEWDYREGEARRKHPLKERGFFGDRGSLTLMSRLDTLRSRGPAEAVEKALSRFWGWWDSEDGGKQRAGKGWKPSPSNINDLLEQYLTERGMVDKMAWLMSITGGANTGQAAQARPGRSGVWHRHRTRPGAPQQRGDAEGSD